MDTKEFKEYLNTCKDRVSAIREKSKELKFSLRELTNIIVETFSDEEKQRFLNEYKKLTNEIKKDVLISIKNDDIKLSILKNEEITKQFATRDFVTVAISLQDEGKQKLLTNKVFLDEKNLEKKDVQKIILSMQDKGKKSVVYNESLLKNYNFKANDVADIIRSIQGEELKNVLDYQNYLKESLGFDNYCIGGFINKLENEDDRIDYIDKYKLETFDLVNVLNKLSDEKKLETLFSEKYELNSLNIVSVLSNMSFENLLDFIKNNREFLEGKNINVFEIVNNFSEEEQLKFVPEMENLDLPLDEKRKVLVVLNEEAKAKIDRSNMSEEYISALDINLKNGKIELDLENDMQIYKGLDELITIRPQEVSPEERDKLLKLAEICPNMKVYDNFDYSYSTGNEFVNGEKWINKVLSGIKEEWSDIQKVAYIDNEIGKKISYSPDFDTEVYNLGNSRALWKIIDSEYGVCNGISQLEQYILKRVEIESEIVSSDSHSFLKLKNIKIPGKDGTNIIGNTILDPTWNLSAHRYGAYPDDFCRSYEEIRKHDLSSDGKDLMCHKNDEMLSDATLEIESEVLREVFHSIGLTKENRDFPIKDLIDSSDKISKSDISIDEKVKKQLELLEKTNQSFAKCQNSTSSIISSILLNNESMKFNKCVVNRVFNKEDVKKSPILYVYYDTGDNKQNFFVANKETGKFEEVEAEVFKKKYECYSMDIQKNNGIRPWEPGANKQEINLNNSSGTILQGDER